MSLSPSPSLSGQLSPSFDAKDDFTPQERNASTDSARQERLAALERRLNRSTTATEDNPTSQDPLPFDDNHAKRTEFRRLVDPGITRPNSKEVALRSLRVNLKSFVPASTSFFFSFLQFFFFIF